MPNDSYTRTFDSLPGSGSRLTALHKLCGMSSDIPGHILKLAVNHDYLFIADICGVSIWTPLSTLLEERKKECPRNGKRTKPNEIWNGFGLYSNGCPLTFALMSLGLSTIHLAKRLALQWPGLRWSFAAKGHSNRMPFDDKNRAKR